MDIDSQFTAIGPKVSETESVIATLVADGSSRVGYSVKRGSESIADFQPKVVDRYNVNMVEAPISRQTYTKPERIYLPHQIMAEAIQRYRDGTYTLVGTATQRVMSVIDLP